MEKSTQQKIRKAQKKVESYKKACAKEEKLDAQYQAAFDAFEKAKARLEEIQYKRQTAQAEASKKMEQVEDAIKEAQADCWEAYEGCPSERRWKAWDESLEQLGVDLTY